jgi:PEP-CTERM motif
MMLKQLTVWMAALAACAAAPAAMAADTLGSASVSVNNLTFRLIDLAPNDGVAPTMTIKGGWSMNQMVNAPDTQYEPGAVYLNPITNIATLVTPYMGGASASFEAPVPGGVFTLSNTGLGVKAALTTDAFKVHAAEPNVDESAVVFQDETHVIKGVSVSSHAVGVAGVANFMEATQPADSAFPSSMFQAADIELSANTLLLVEGSVSVGLTLDRSFLESVRQSLQSSMSSDPMQMMSSSLAVRGDVRAMALATFETSAGQDDPSGQILHGIANSSSSNLYSSLEFNDEGFLTTSGVDASGSVATDGLSQSLETTKPFFATMVNATNQAITGKLSFAAEASVYQTYDLYTEEFMGTEVIDISAPPVDIDPGTQPPAIPEPSTYLLMGLGLVGMYLVRRGKSAR